MSHALTPKQAAVLTVIRRHIAEKCQPPSIREIGADIGVLSSCTVQRHLDALVKKGYIVRDRYKYRSIRVLGDPGVVAPADRIAELERENTMLRRELAAVRHALAEAREER
jgi:SOS-response transcriptional repressor LexA